MATVLLSAAGAAIGGSIGGSVLGLSGAVIGRAVGATVGQFIDQSLLGVGSEVVETGKLDRYRLTGASEGTAIPLTWGRIRIGGQVIWSTRFKEDYSTSQIGGKGAFGGGATTKEYSYSVSLAIALCRGEILRVGRVWADGMEVGLDELNMRVYTGTEHQGPDPKIEAVEGTENTPRYRGVAYVVVEDLELSRFGNRVPQFSFEVIRATDSSLVPEEAKSLSDTIKAVSLIPGTGEYSLATTPVHYSSGFGWNETANMNASSGLTDFATSLSHLNAELPKCESVSLVVSWFGDDLRCSFCSIRPKVEQVAIEGDGMPWEVCDLERHEADTVSEIDGRPVYGGTPTDRSVIEAIVALRESGKKVVFYPFILMDQLEGNELRDPWADTYGQPHLPWRGRITTSLAPGLAGSPDGTSIASLEVRDFFGSTVVENFEIEGDTVRYNGPDEWSFRRFILHYAHLCAAAGGVDSFCIGSEMRALTQIRGRNSSFPAVTEMINLASDVREVLGNDTKIGYAADWSEYFGYHPTDGSGDVFFHLDPLWADENIDFVGIDNYMPISDWRNEPDHADSYWNTIYDLEYLKSNICGGEGYDWYYADEGGRENQARIEIQDSGFGEPWVFRFKDLKSWWSKKHFNRIGGKRSEVSTPWTPESKPIWFTELGCAAIDKATNQPNKFVDPKSSESSIPWYSTGARDDLIQAQYIRAMYTYWDDVKNNPNSKKYDGRMIDMSRAHVWAWDARPFPVFPSRGDLWTDGENYLRGHWLNGRTTSESLAAVVAETCAMHGVDDFDVSSLYGLVRGYSVQEVSSVRSMLQPLELAHGFDASECRGEIRFRTRFAQGGTELDPSCLAVTDELKGMVEISRVSAVETPGRVRLNYVQADGDFETRTAETAFPEESSPVVSSLDLPLALTPSEARRITERWLTEVSISAEKVRFVLPPSKSDISAGDTVELRGDSNTTVYRVDQVELGGTSAVEAVRIEPNVYRPGGDFEEVVAIKSRATALPVHGVFLDLPTLPGSDDSVSPYLAVSAHPWLGEVAVYKSSNGDGYRLSSLIGSAATIGVTESPMKAADPGLIDRSEPLRIRLGSGELSTTEMVPFLNGDNLMAIGDQEADIWEVLQFRKATLVAQDTYEISERLRGQLGTEGEIPSEWPVGSTVVLLDAAPKQVSLASAERGLERNYLIGPASRPYSDQSYRSHTKVFSGRGLRPFSPVHVKASFSSEDHIDISWVRRTRVDGDSWEGFEVPLGENSEQYQVNVVAGGSIKRQAICQKPSWQYLKTERDADGIDGSFEIRVAQISDRYGVGPFRSIVIDV